MKATAVGDFHEAWQVPFRHTTDRGGSGHFADSPARNSGTPEHLGRRTTARTHRRTLRPCSRADRVASRNEPWMIWTTTARDAS